MTELRTVYADKLDLEVATICNYIQDEDLILQPEFQREHIWTILEEDLIGKFIRIKIVVF